MIIWLKNQSKVRYRTCQLRFRAPYIVKAVSSRGVASALGIEAGDELVAVGREAVAGFEWSQLVAKLAPRPVQVSFYRPPKAALRSELKK